MNNQQWRLPNIEELKSLLWGELPKDEKFGWVSINPAVKAAFHEAFGKRSTSWFWSSSACDIVSGNAWRGYFDKGSVSHIGKDYRGKVRLVRGNMNNGTWREGDKTSDRYSVTDDVVTDNKTGLQWKRQPEGGFFSWREAVKAFNKEEDTMTTTDLQTGRCESTSSVLLNTARLLRNEFPQHNGVYYWLVGLASEYKNQGDRK